MYNNKRYAHKHLYNSHLWKLPIAHVEVSVILKQPMFAALDANDCEITTLLRPNLRFVASLDANNTLAIYLPDIKFQKFIGMGKCYEDAKLQLDRLSNDRVMRL